MIEAEAALHAFGGDPTAFVDLQADTPDLLPYSTLVAARTRRVGPLDALLGVYEWQGAPLLFIADEERAKAESGGVDRLRRLLSLRGDAPYMGLLSPGRLTVYQLGLDTRRAHQARIATYSDEPKWRESLADLGNRRPTCIQKTRWVSDVVLSLLTDAIDTLSGRFRLDGADAISLVGRALFTRFLADRELLPSNWLDASNGAYSHLFSSSRKARSTCEWLDQTFNGDFLPLDYGLVDRLPKEAFGCLSDILNKAPGGQFYIQWQEDWAHLDFAHIPVGVLSQAYERFLQTHAPQQQRKEGSYYTPTAIAELMVQGAFGALRRGGSADSAKILDPSAGAGVFLISAFRELVAERWRAGTRPDTDGLRTILYEQIRGFDVNEAALRFAALGLYLISIELDPNPEPVEKLKFERLRGTVLRNVGTPDGGTALGSLDPSMISEHRNAYDLVIGNPPWTTGTKVSGWLHVLQTIKAISLRRNAELGFDPPIPNEALDLPFVWYAMEWARPGAQIAFALHARILFQQGEGMPLARSALFQALDITGVVNGSELRQTKVWPGIAAPFCIMFAVNTQPTPASAFRFLNPRVEERLNEAGSFRLDTSNSPIVRAEDAATNPTVFKTLFRGTHLDLEILERLGRTELETIEKFWSRSFGRQGRALGRAGNGYQALRSSTTQPVSASHLRGLPHLAAQHLDKFLINTAELPRFSTEWLHRARNPEIYEGPLLLVHKSPPAHAGRIRTAVSDSDLVFSETYYGYSAREAIDGHTLVRFLSLVIGSRISLWYTLVTSGEFGFEREVVEKFIVDRLLVPSFEKFDEGNKAVVRHLFDQVSRENNEHAWRLVDEWLSTIYELRASDLAVIEDTLRYNLPFASTRTAAQRPTRKDQAERFVGELRNELWPWVSRLGSSMDVNIVEVPAVSPWGLLRIDFAQNAETMEESSWTAILDAANSLAATEVLVPMKEASMLWIAKLNQARYWSASEAKLLSRRIIWEHIDLFGAKKAS